MKASDIQSKLYSAARKDPDRRFHTLIDKIYNGQNLVVAVSKLPNINMKEQVDLEPIGEQLRNGIIPPQVYHTALIPKKKNCNEMRMIFLSRNPDEMVRQNAIKQIIEPIFEASFQECSYAYRKGKGALNAIHDFKAYADSGFIWAVKLDIRKFFDSIQHKRLMRLVETRIADNILLKLIEGVIKTGYIKYGKVIKPNVGILQGMVLAPLLSNIYLNVLDRYWNDAGYENCRMLRYSDDILIVGNSRNDVEKALSMVDGMLEKLGLSNKTDGVISLKHEAVEFLGFVNKISQGRLSQMPTPRALQYMEAEMQEGIRSGGDKLKQKIDGWMNYYGINVDASRLVRSITFNTTGRESLF